MSLSRWNEAKGGKLGMESIASSGFVAFACRERLWSNHFVRRSRCTALLPAFLAGRKTTHQAYDISIFYISSSCITVSHFDAPKERKKMKNKKNTKENLSME